MINLLPLEEKTAVCQRRKLKLVLIFEVALAFFLVSILLLFSAFRVYLFGELELQRAVFSQREKEVNVQEMADFKKRVESLNDDLQKIKDFDDRRLKLVAVFQKLFDYLPEGSSLTNVSFLQDDQGARFNLAGFAKTREALLEFKQDLERDGNFSRVDFPPVNWVLPANIDFSLNLEIER